MHPLQAQQQNKATGGDHVTGSDGTYRRTTLPGLFFARKEKKAFGYTGVVRAA